MLLQEINITEIAAAYLVLAVSEQLRIALQILHTLLICKLWLKFSGSSLLLIEMVEVLVVVVV